MKAKTEQPHNDGSTNADNSVVQAAEADPLLDAPTVEVVNPPSSEGAAIDGVAASSPSDASVSQPVGGVRASEGEAEPRPTSTGSELEAADRALLYAEDARLRRLAEAHYRENKRRTSWQGYPGVMDCPFVRRFFGTCGHPFSSEENAELYWQVEDEFAEIKRKQLSRKQGQDKKD
jgi:hypothetical protein